MLNERRARALIYDAASDVARLQVGAAVGGRKSVDAQLLLDAQGFLVGIDLESHELSRTVVMLGPHEKVDRTLLASVIVTHDAEGQPAEVELRDARRVIRAAEKNPYA
jgi:hypothetical protein